MTLDDCLIRDMSIDPLEKFVADYKIYISGLVGRPGHTNNELLELYEDLYDNWETSRLDQDTEDAIRAALSSNTFGDRAHLLYKSYLADYYAMLDDRLEPFILRCEVHDGVPGNVNIYYRKQNNSHRVTGSMPYTPSFANYRERDMVAEIEPLNKFVTEYTSYIASCAQKDFTSDHNMLYLDLNDNWKVLTNIDEDLKAMLTFDIKSRRLGGKICIMYVDAISTYYAMLDDNGHPCIIECRISPDVSGRDTCIYYREHYDIFEDDDPDEGIKFTPEEVLEFISMY